MKNGILLIISITTLIMSSCHGVSSYSGDGYLVDNGPFAANERYVLDLGVVELNKQNKYTFHIGSLPSESFIIGLKITTSSENRVAIEQKLVNPTILFELLGANGEVVFRGQSSLGSWIWSERADDNSAFVYRREHPSTFFIPHKGRKYVLTVEIVKADSSDISYTTSLLAKSGGWK